MQVFSWEEMAWEGGVFFFALDSLRALAAPWLVQGKCLRRERDKKK